MTLGRPRRSARRHEKVMNMPQNPCEPGVRTRHGHAVITPL
ncbi:hypothetical protein [Nannocystis pusilla]